ncbi:hypothetical protein EDB84DRAFT_1440576 [Lactarius hengduanensis]|nr:hypothetical protein EDB84DRAFT_1440576 [Lactarius hengduanensis]
MVAPSLHGRRRSLRAADSRRGRVAVAPWPCRGCAVVVSSRNRLSSCESSCGLHHTACVVAWGVVVVACGLSPRVGVASVVGVGGAGGGHGSPFARGPPPLLQGQDRRGHAIHHTTTPYLSPRRRLRLHLAAHKPVAAASNPSPRTSPPPPPPLTARKSRRNATSARARKNRRSATSARRATPTATTPTPTTTVTRRREQHRGRNDGDAGEADDDGEGV